MRVNLLLIEGLWAARNRATDTPEQRETLRSWLRQAVQVERGYRKSLAS